MLFVDEFTRMTWVTLIKVKHEVFSEFQKFKMKAEKQSGQKLKVLELTMELSITLQSSRSSVKRME